MKSTYAAFLSGLFLIGLLLPALASASIVLGDSNVDAISSGLIGYWPLDGNTTNWSTGITTDVSRNGVNAQMVNMSTTSSPTAGKIGSALAFNGSSSYVQPSTFASIPSSITLAVWIKPNASGGVVMDETGTGGWHDAEIEVETTNSIKVCVWTGSETCAVAATGIVYGDWYQVVLDYNNSTHTLSGYVNGVLGASTGATKQYPGSGLAYVIGQQDATNGGTGTYFSGTIDDVRIYGRALSAQEISLLYGIGLFQAGNTPAENSSFSIAQRGLNSGLVVYLPFDGNTTNWATGITQDVSGSGNSGQLTDMSTSTSPIAGKIGQALQFNGNNSVVVLPSSLATSLFNGQAFTVSAWIYPTVSKQDEGILNSDLATANNQDLHLAIRNGVPYLGFYGDDLSGGTVPLDQWSYVTFSYAGGTGGARQIYINGALIVNDTSSGTLNTSGGTVEVGTSYQPATTVMQGNIDDLRIYDRTLSAQEVEQLYQSGQITIGHSNTTQNSSSVGLNSGLIGYWTFDGPSISWATGVVHDMSSGTTNGQLEGMSTTTSPVIGKVGQALSFNGTSQYVALNNTVGATTGAITVTAWIKPASVSATAIIAARNSETGGSPQTWNLYISSGQAFFQSSADSYLAASGGSIQVGHWYFVAGTYTGTGTKIRTVWVNGTAVGSVTNSSDPPTSINSSAATIGVSSTDNPAHYFQGTIDDVRIYNRALSTQELAQLYAAGR